MSALWACRASLRRRGRAKLLISWSRGLSVGYCTAVTSVSLPLLMVIFTWTGPQRVWIVSPVTVLVTVVVDPPEPPDVPELELLDGAGTARPTFGVECGFRDSS